MSVFEQTERKPTHLKRIETEQTAILLPFPEHAQSGGEWIRTDKILKLEDCT